MFKISIVAIAITIGVSGCGGGSGGNDQASSGVAYTGNLYDQTPVETCNGHLMSGNAGASNQVLCRLGYAVGFNYTTKIANWVQYYITASSVSASVARVDNFREDTDIPQGSRATLSDYSEPVYDRGHMAPNATMDFSVASMDESFLLSNIAPQLPSLNRYAWADFEQYVRDCAVAQGTLVVATGPVFKSTVHTSIGNGVAVPDGFYNVILKPGSPAMGFAVIIPHQAITNTQIKDYVTSIDAVEAATGLNFFAAVRDDIENRVEKSTSPICALPWGAPVTGGGAFGACGSKTTCGQMTSCSEAYYFLNTCGRISLDADKDGIPCESICK